MLNVSAWFAIALPRFFSQSEMAIAPLPHHPLKATPRDGPTRQTIWPVVSMPPFAPLPPENRAIVEVEIPPNQEGRVKFQGTWWPAKSVDGKAIALHTIVEVIGRENITLLVKDIH